MRPGACPLTSPHGGMASAAQSSICARGIQSGSIEIRRLGWTVGPGVEPDLLNRGGSDRQLGQTEGVGLSLALCANGLPALRFGSRTRLVYSVGSNHFVNSTKRGSPFGLPLFVELAERVGFEPTVRGYRTHTFQACSFDRSDTSPELPSTCRHLSRGTEVKPEHEAVQSGAPRGFQRFPLPGLLYPGSGNGVTLPVASVILAAPSFSTSSIRMTACMGM